MRSSAGVIFGAALLAVFALCAHAAADEWKVAKLTGRVVIQSGPIQGVSLSSGMSLKSGSVLVADKTGQALLVHGGDQMIVSPNSMVAVPKDGGGMTAVLQRFGQVELDVSHQAKPHFVVETPFLAALVKGTHFTVRVLKHGASVTVQRGRVEVDDFLTGEKVDVLPGQTATVQAGQHLTVTGPGVLSPVIPGKVKSAPGNPFSSGGITAGVGSGTIGASLGAGNANAGLGSVASVSAGKGSVGASVGGGSVASVSAGGGKVGVGVGGGSVASVNAGSGGVSASVGGGTVGASVGGGSGVSVSVGGLSVSLGGGGGGGRHH